MNGDFLAEKGRQWPPVFPERRVSTGIVIGFAALGRGVCSGRISAAITTALPSPSPIRTTGSNYQGWSPFRRSVRCWLASFRPLKVGLHAAGRSRVLPTATPPFSHRGAGGFCLVACGYHLVAGASFRHAADCKGQKRHPVRGRPRQVKSAACVLHRPGKTSCSRHRLGCASARQARMTRMRHGSSKETFKDVSEFRIMFTGDPERPLCLIRLNERLGIEFSGSLPESRTNCAGPAARSRIFSGGNDGAVLGLYSQREFAAPYRFQPNSSRPEAETARYAGGAAPAQIRPPRPVAPRSGQSHPDPRPPANLAMAWPLRAMGSSGSTWTNIRVSRLDCPGPP